MARCSTETQQMELINMMVYPIVSNINGKIIAGHTSQDGALGVASALVRHADGADLVHVGEPFETELTGGMLVVAGATVPLRPVYAQAKDPYRLMVSRLLDMAREPRPRARKTTGATKAADTAARATKATPAPRRATTRKPKVGATA